MWLLNRSKKEKKEVDNNTLQREAIEQLKSFRDVGEKFNYCGVELIVEELFFWNIGVTGSYLIARMTAAYKNKLGEIKYLYFYPKHLPALIAENR